MYVRRLALGGVIGFSLVAGASPAGATAPTGEDAIPVATNRLLSRTPDGVPGNWSSGASSISDDGRWVAFQSNSSDLVRGDRKETDIFLLDRSSGKIILVSQTYGGQPKEDRHSEDPMISGDGRYIVYSSWVTDIVPDDVNGFADIFRYDRVTAETTLVSRSSAGVQGDGPSTTPAISTDGSVIAFASQARNLDPDDVNGVGRDVFVRDLESGTTRLVSHKPNGESGRGISTLYSISADGSTVGFTSNTPRPTKDDVYKKTFDAFAYDVATDVNELVSKSSTGEAASRHSPSSYVSGDGRYVAFASDAKDLVAGDRNRSRDVFVRDRETGTTTVVSTTSDGKLRSGASFATAISQDGRYVLIASEAPLEEPNGAPGIRQVYLHDRGSGTTVMISRSPDGTAGEDSSDYFLHSGDFTADNRLITYDSLAANLTDLADANTFNDVFLYRRA